MAQFPKLRSGSYAQYPVGQTIVRPVRVLRLSDGTEQRFPLKKARRRWVLQLEGLDEGELAAIERFYLDHRAGNISFDFVDPWTGEAITGCRFLTNELSFTARSSFHGVVRLEIEEQET